MATSSSMPATPPSLTDLPSDLLHEIVNIFNESDDSSLIVGPDLASLVLSHSSFSDPAETLLAKHQDYINTYRNIIIDANNEPFSSRDSHLAETIDRLNITSSSAEGNNTITFQSPVMMLVGMHKNKAIPNYVRSLVYLAPASGSDEALSCSQTALELFESKEIEDDWDKRLSATMDDILPDGAAAEEETLSLQSLSEGHKGKCITLLLHSLPHLTSLSLSGDERYFTVKTRYTIGFGVRTPTKFRSSI